MKGTINRFACAVGLGLVLSAFTASADTILSWDVNGVGWYAPGSAYNNATDAQLAVNWLIGRYNGGAEPVLAKITSWDLAETNLKPLPAPADNAAQQASFTPVTPGTASYILGKYGNVAYVFYIGDITGTDPIVLPVVEPLSPVGTTGQGLSHQVVLTAPRRVPDAASSLALLGMAMTSLCALRRWTS